MVETEGSQVINSKKKKNIEFLSLKINFVLANSVDPDEMQHYVTFHLGLHCLPKFKGFWYTIKRVKHICAMTREIQQCGILTSEDSDESCAASI